MRLFGHLDPKQRKRVLLGAAAGAVVLVLFIRHRQAAGSTSTQAVQPDLGTGATSSGVPSGLGSDTAPSATDTGGVQPTTDLTPITDQLAQIETDLAGLQTSTAGGGGDPGPGPGDGLGPGPAAAATQPAGFWWGGQWITSAADLQAFERKHGNSSFNLQLWAYQHPGAAESIGLSVPSKAPSSPAATTPGPQQARPRSSVPSRKTGTATATSTATPTRATPAAAVKHYVSTSPKRLTKIQTQTHGRGMGHL